VLDLGAGPAHVSLLLARYVREVVVLEPEEAMLDEGRQRAATASVANLTFVLGGSDDLPRLTSSHGAFAAVVISQALHWMRDQGAVLRCLDELLDRRRGAVALIGYVNEPDYNRVLLDRAPWNQIEVILERPVAGVPRGPNPAGRHDPFPEILACRAAVLCVRDGGATVARCGPRGSLFPEQHTRPTRDEANGVRGRGARRARRCSHHAVPRAARRQRAAEEAPGASCRPRERTVIAPAIATPPPARSYGTRRPLARAINRDQ